jgi:hypothetical protein
VNIFQPGPKVKRKIQPHYQKAGFGRPAFQYRKTSSSERSKTSYSLNIRLSPLRHFYITKQASLQLLIWLMLSLPLS